MMSRINQSVDWIESICIVDRKLADLHRILSMQTRVLFNPCDFPEDDNTIVSVNNSLGSYASKSQANGLRNLLAPNHFTIGCLVRLLVHSTMIKQPKSGQTSPRVMIV